MKISISNYKSLKNFEYEIQDNKINFLFGLSGTGKSSICEALIDEKPEQNKCFRSADSPIIKIDSCNPDKDHIKCFNNESVSVFVENIDCNDEKVKKIFIDDDRQLEKAQSKLNQILEELRKSIENYKVLDNKLVTFYKTFLGPKFSKNITKTMPIYRLGDLVEKSKTTRNTFRKSICEMPDGKLAWIINGKKFSNDDKCPYCGKTMGKELISKIEKMSNFDDKLLKSSIGQNEFNKLFFNTEFSLDRKTINKIEENSISSFRAHQGYEQINNLMEQLFKTNVNVSNVKKIEISPETKSIFPNLSIEINKYNSHILTIKKLLGEAKAKTKKTLYRNVNYVNYLLKIFNIPYYIEAEINHKKIDDYKIIHKDDSGKNDDTRCLSCGEKFVVSLILFTIRMSKDNENNFIIYDDPISSFDEKRRYQILKLIQEKISNKTVLILSHDNVFIKYALANRKQNIIGNIDYFSNIHDEIKIKNISKDDFVNIQEAVKQRNKQINNIYLKVMNIRFQNEDNHRTNIYKYLSGITHLLDDNTFQYDLEKNKINEDNIIEKIKKEFNITLKKYKQENYMDLRSVDNLTFFEKCILLRIKLDINPSIMIDKIVKDELDNLVHMNDRLYITLNPYEYVFYSEQLYDAVNEYVKDPFVLKENSL